MRQVGKLWVLITVLFLAGLATWVMAATWPRDDTGVPAPVVSFLGSGGRPTLVSVTDPLPVNTGIATTSSTDPSGWGRSWVPAAITFRNVDNDAAITRDFNTGTFVIYAATSLGQMYRSVLGTSFTDAGSPSATAEVYQIDANTSQRVYVHTGKQRSLDGMFWTSFTLPTPSGFSGPVIGRWVASQGATIVMAVGDGLTGAGVSACRSTDGAATWTCAPAFSGGTGLYVATTSPRNVLMVQALASPRPGVWLLVDRALRVYRSTNDAATWSFVTQLITGAPGIQEWAIACPALDTCLISGFDSNGFTPRTYRSTDGGQTWALMTSGAPNEVVRHWVVFGSDIVVGITGIDGLGSVWWSQNAGSSFSALGQFVPGGTGCSIGFWTSATDGRGTAVVVNDCETVGGTGRRVMVTRPFSVQDRRITDDQGRILRVRSDGSLDVNVLNPTSTVTANQGTALGSTSTNHPWTVVPVQRNQTLSNQAVIGAPNTEVIVSVAGASGELVWWYSIVAQCNAAPTATPVDLTITGFNTVRWRYRGVTQQPVFIQFNPPFTDGIAATGDHSVRLSPCGAGISGLLSVQASRF
jgi:hypothetical protein